MGVTSGHKGHGSTGEGVVDHQAVLTDEGDHRLDCSFGDARFTLRCRYDDSPRGVRGAVVCPRPGM